MALRKQIIRTDDPEEFDEAFEALMETIRSQNAGIEAVKHVEVVENETAAMIMAVVIYDDGSGS